MNFHAIPSGGSGILHADKGRGVRDGASGRLSQLFCGTAKENATKRSKLDIFCSRHNPVVACYEETNEILNVKRMGTLFAHCWGWSPVMFIFLLRKHVQLDAGVSKQP
jgi:hypothetical protein